MARGTIGLQSLTASKEAGAVVSSAPVVEIEQEAPAKRGRGRPPKRKAPALGGQTITFGQTIRMTPGLRKALRAAADAETDAKGKVVSVHDVILDAVHAHLRRKGIAIEELTRIEMPQISNFAL